MKHISLITILLLILLNNKLSHTQTDTIIILSDTSEFVKLNTEEILLENFFEDTEDSQLLDDLDYLKRNPIDLNSAPVEELETVPFINSFVAKDIVEYRKSNGRIKSKRDILNIDGITDEIYKLIKLYIIVKQSPTDNIKSDDEKILNSSKYKKTEIIENTDICFKTRLQQELQTKEGFLNGKYSGSKSKIYNQLNFKNIKYNIEGNFTFEKDAGESNLMDFSSMYFKLKNYKFIKEALIGDYVITTGQGLCIWGSPGYSKSSLAVDAVKKRNSVIKGYTSANESQFFRGAAVRMYCKYIDITIFYSDKYYDASIDTTVDEVSSFYFDGYHRTNTEKNRENSVNEKLFGGRIFYDKNEIKLGATYWTSKFSIPVENEKSRQLYAFSGSKANMLSFDYNVLYKNGNYFGELARSQSGSIAVLSAVHFNFSNIADILFLYRYYPNDFEQVHSFGFGENNGNTQNERGFYAGLTLFPVKDLVINTYYDQFKFPYLTYFNPVATSGNDFLINTEWRLNKNFSINFRYKNKNKEETKTVQDELSRGIKKIVNREQINIRMGFDYETSNRISLKSRYDYIFVSYDICGGNNKGSMFYTDLKCIPFKGFTTAIRIIFFQTDGYDSRIYEYEDDIRGVMSNTSLFAKGRRWYFMIRCKPYKSIELYGKYAETYLDGVSSIGTGEDLIHGDINNRLNFGMEIHF